MVNRGSVIDIDSVSHQFAVAGARPRSLLDRVRGRPAPVPTRAQELGRLRVLTNVSLHIESGEFVALLGPSGCGKSTLLRLLAGLERPARGDVRVDGATVTGPDPHRALMFQDPTLFPWRTVEQNVSLGPQARGTVTEDRDRVAGALALVGLDGFRDTYPAQLSGGMAQRVALARALVNRPRLFLLDEPLGKLDALTRATLQAEIGRLWQDDGFTAVLVTHDVDEALRLADRVVVLTARPGKVVRDVHIDLPRPRVHDAPRYLELRREILALLGETGRSAA
ncbi:ABC transporter ATP-binding protein [Nocardia aurantia]|uniref:Bicarbonate transport ATP-binding protein CmpC n=1 Tax=Nocardia aurantia TaxID=2585199 RepID=A0A7K0DIY0_9NOCA|nr:ABC transporter ATP-binding protein [Nocardia aurantia]MQY25776.1 Bicarbonate transport ATP-binding protein CmpC [Nocardia aurantia]